MAAAKLPDISRPITCPFAAKPRVNANETSPWACLIGYDQVVVYMINNYGNPAQFFSRAKLKQEACLMNASDTAKVQRYLRQRFGNHKLTLARRENKDDSAELMLEDEFIGVVFQDNEDGETCYHVQISILEEDLDD
jgi:Na+-transporting NADH:ubiquinone oxidoreductase subunit NqrA